MGSKLDFKKSMSGGEQKADAENTMSDAGGLLGGYYEDNGATDKVRAPLHSSSRKVVEKTEANFLFGLTNQNSVDYYFEDPTFLTFSMRIVSENSPLFNYENGLVTAKKTMAGGALDFIQKYSTIKEIADREGIYNEFVNNVSKIFVTGDASSGGKNYYINKVAGLDKLFSSAKFTEYGKDVLKVTVTEDVGLRSTYMAELYNNLIYSYKNGHYLIPDNCLRFDLEVYIMDYRKFKLPFLKDDGSYEYRINYDCPRIIYRLMDCNFDFFDSRPHAETITRAGFGAGIDSNASELEFTIRYKSVERVFTSNLIHNSVRLSNKKAIVAGSNDEVDYSKMASNSLTGDDVKNSELNKVPKSKNPLTSVYGGGNSIRNSLKPESLVDSIKNKAKGTLDELEALGMSKLNELKNRATGPSLKDLLLNKLKNEIRELTGIPKIYPENLYEQDITDRSLTSRINSDVVDAANTAERILDGLI